MAIAQITVILLATDLSESAGNAFGYAARRVSRRCKAPVLLVRDGNE